MTTYKVDKIKVLYPDESFRIAGACFYVQKILGRFAREKQYCDLLEERFKLLNIPYHREFVVGTTGNRVGFIFFDKILLEVKALPFLKQPDFDQVERYLDILDLQLGLLVNFQATSALPRRVLKSSTPNS